MNYGGRKKGDMVKIVWIDPETDGGWFAADELPELEPVTSVGIYIHENERTLWVASSYHAGTKEFADRMVYPKGVILNVEIIESVNPRYK